MNSKVMFYLANYKGLKVLEILIDMFIDNIFVVIISRDNNVKNDYSQSMIELCENNNIAFQFKDTDFSNFDGYRLSIGWRRLISSKKLIVFHDSLLPKYRGFSPLVNMLINGEKIFGVSGFLANEKYDRGEIFFQKSIEIHYPIKIFKLIKLISELYIDGIKFIMPLLISNSIIKTSPQDERKATYSVWRDMNDYIIDWNSNSSEIVRFVDAVGYPFLGATTFIKDKKVYIVEAEISNISVTNSHPGKILTFELGKPIVITKNGCIKINKLIDEENNELTYSLKLKTRFQPNKLHGDSSIDKI